VRFSEAGWQDLKGFYEATRATLELAAAVFVAESPDLAHKLLSHKARVRDFEIELREKHFERLQSGHQESFETTDLHLEILSQYKHINHQGRGTRCWSTRHDAATDGLARSDRLVRVPPGAIAPHRPSA
jgi:Na+/phosphate symporter